MELTSPEPNPKDFQNFDDYLRALKMHKEFKDMSNKVSEIYAENMSEDEEKKAMEELGFTYHEDYICEREFCQEHWDCLSNILETIQFCINDDIFWWLLANNDHIFSRNKEWYFDFVTCDDIPQNWFQTDSQENKIINLYLETTNTLTFNNLKKLSYNELIKDENTRQFIESFYFILQMTLINKNHKNFIKHKRVVQEFLLNNEIINKDLCEKSILLL